MSFAIRARRDDGVVNQLRTIVRWTDTTLPSGEAAHTIEVQTYPTREEAESTADALRRVYGAPHPDRRHPGIPFYAFIVEAHEPGVSPSTFAASADPAVEEHVVTTPTAPATGARDLCTFSVLAVTKEAP